MIDTSINLKMNKPVERCSECDEETQYYNIFIIPPSERRVICAKCLIKEEKGFTNEKGFNRGTNGGSGTFN